MASFISLYWVSIQLLYYIFHFLSLNGSSIEVQRVENLSQICYSLAIFPTVARIWCSAYHEKSKLFSTQFLYYFFLVLSLNGSSSEDKGNWSSASWKSNSKSATPQGLISSKLCSSLSRSWLRREHNDSIASIKSYIYAF